ncbi:hypothetical protein OXIME_000598 [Oxyplasma meridianum]|uniref:Uncharacterized protein n=1 Tax=Oxyplasma meridianum TaxID=3073602 RepID=A0AAX4NF16_9ARCH
MGKEKQNHNDKTKGNERGSGRDNIYRGHNNEETFGLEKAHLIMKLVSLKSEEARLHMEYVDTKDLIVRNLLSLSGLLGEYRLAKRNEDLNEFETRFDILFNKYMKKN